MCYTYDNLSRVTARTVKKLSDNSVVSTETFNYDAAGNITDAPDSCFQYDTNNRLVVFNGNAVTYDMDGNMTSDGVCPYSYDSANRLTSHGGHTYTYNAEDVRIRNLCAEEDTTYTYNTNAKLSNNEEFDLSDVDYLEVGTSVAIDVGFSMLDIKKPNKTKELNKVVSSLDDKIARETRRANKEVISTLDGKIARKTKRSIEIGKKRIAEASRAKSIAIGERVLYMFIDPFSPKQVSQNFVEASVDKLFFDKDEEVYSRK